MRVADYIEQNMETIETLVSIGALPICQITYYQIYKFHQTTTHLKSKMDRYIYTAEHFKMCVTSVRNALKIMGGTVPVKRS